MSGWLAKLEPKGCPCCGAPPAGKLAAADSTARAGEVSLCVSCFAVCRYTDQLELEWLTLVQWLALDSKLREAVSEAAFIMGLERWQKTGQIHSGAIRLRGLNG